MPSWWSKLLKPRRFGLRTEIIVNLLLIMGAALLFSGFLLLRLIEHELVEQKVAGLREQMELSGFMLSLEPLNKTLRAPGENSEQIRDKQFRWVFSVLLPDALFLVDERNDVVVSAFSGENLLPDRTALNNCQKDNVLTESVVYRSALIPWAKQGGRHVTMTVPVSQAGRYGGALQGRFSLEDVALRSKGTRSLLLIYCAIYSSGVFIFGLWLLGRSIIRPVRQLTQATQRVAEGNLAISLPTEGPTEIRTLSLAFNEMTSSLQENRHQLQIQISSLGQANEELRRTQAELLRSEKLASVGRLAAGMAHEIGNPLGAIVGYLELLRHPVANVSQDDLLRRALAESQRIDRLVRELLDYANPATGDVEWIDLAELLREAATLLRHQGLFDSIGLQDNLPENLPPVRANRHRLLQVQVNLLLNAKDAAPEGKIWLRGGVGEGEVWFEVEDDGCGISPDSLQKLFDPFYTTKEPGRGRGLGLSVCYTIIEEAGGRIEVDSQPNQRTRFRVVLPSRGAS